MPLASKPTHRVRHLLEFIQVGTGARTDSPALKIDRDAGIIFGVRVLGRYSRNKHGEPVDGTEYSRECMTKALPMYEGVKVKTNHPASPADAAKARPIDDTFGVLKNVRLEADEAGDPVVRGDLHYRKFHPMTADVLDDVERKLGLWGLSHNATAARERFDRVSRRLVIEELGQVRSVDLVDKPATGRNLWESHVSEPKTVTLRQLLEAREPKLSAPRKKWAKVLLEDEMMAPSMDAPAEATEGASDEDALWEGVRSACGLIIDGDGTADEKIEKIKKYLQGHEKMTQEKEPEEPVEEEEECDPKDAKKKKDAMESEELVELRREKKARELCESLGFAPSALQIEAVAGIRDPKRQRELAESYKPAAPAPARPGFKTPKAAAPGAIKPPAGNAGDKPRETPESEVADAAEDLRVLMGD